MPPLPRLPLTPAARTLAAMLIAASPLLVSSPAFAAPAAKPAAPPVRPPAKAAPQPDPKPDEPAPGDSPAWMEKHKAHVARAANGGIDLLFLGDFFMEGWAIGGKHGYGARGRRIWEACFLEHNGVNFGTRGDKTQQLLYRIGHGELDGIKPKAVMIMVGTNNLPPNTVEETVSGISAVVAAAHEKLPDSKILLIGLFPRGTLAREPIRVQIRQVNEALAKLDDGKSVFFMDLGPKLLTPEGKFTEQATDDGVLLNPKGYMIWAEAITPTFEEWLGTPITRYKLGMRPPKKAEPAGGVSGAKPAASQPAEDE